MTRTRAASLVAVSAATALVLAACGGGGGGGTGDASEGGIFAGCKTDPNTCNSVPVAELQAGGQITYVIEKNIDNFLLTSSDGNIADASNALAGMLPYVYGTTPDLKPALNEDVMVSAEQTSVSPQTIVYTIKPEAAWNDGTPITADDFVFNWKYQNAKDCPECTPASTSGYDQVASVVGSDGGKTVTVTFATPYPDWQGMWSSGSRLYPAHIAAQAGDLATPAGIKAAETAFGTTPPTWSGGPYQVESWDNNVALTLVPNPQWYGTTKPTLDRMIFRVITDATQSPLALQNDEVQIIYPQPQVDLVQQVANIPGVSQQQSLGLTWEHFDLNTANPYLALEPLRDALFTAVNRQEIIDKTVGQFNPDVTPLNSNVLLPGQEGFEDVVTQAGIGGGDIEAAKKILTDAGYTGVGTALAQPDGQVVPPLRISYTTGNAIRQSQSEIFAAAAKQLGVTFTVTPIDSLGSTLTSGDFDAIVYAYVASPFPFSNAAQNFVSTSASNYTRYANPEIDRLIQEASSIITDAAGALGKLNEANRLISGASVQLPLYQKPTFIAVRDNVANVRDNATLDGPTYNIDEWGLRAS
jgi:peptide/nickel transport system substrate-binding protein